MTSSSNRTPRTSSVTGAASLGPVVPPLSIPRFQHALPSGLPRSAQVLLGSGVKTALTRATPDLADRLVAKEEAAYEELVRLHGPRMRAVAQRYVGRTDADDALQGAFLNVVRSIATFQHACSLETWLHRVVVNQSLMILRRRRRKPETILDVAALSADGMADPRRRDVPAPDVVLAAAEFQARIGAEIARLPVAERSVATLRVVFDLDVATISRLLQIGASTVKVRLHRAKRVMRRAADLGDRELATANRHPWGIRRADGALVTPPQPDVAT